MPFLWLTYIGEKGELWAKALLGAPLGKKINILLISNMFNHLIGHMHILFLNMVETIFFA